MPRPGAPPLPAIEFCVICAATAPATTTPLPVFAVMTLWLIVVVAVPPRTSTPNCSGPAAAALPVIVLPSIASVPAAFATSIPELRLAAIRLRWIVVVPPTMFTPMPSNTGFPQPLARISLPRICQSSTGLPVPSRRMPPQLWKPIRLCCATPPLPSRTQTPNPCPRAPAPGSVKSCAPVPTTLPWMTAPRTSRTTMSALMPAPLPKPQIARSEIATFAPFTSNPETSAPADVRRISSSGRATGASSGSSPLPATPSAPVPTGPPAPMRPVFVSRTVTPSADEYAVPSIVVSAPVICGSRLVTPIRHQVSPPEAWFAATAGTKRIAFAPAMLFALRMNWSSVPCEWRAVPPPSSSDVSPSTLTTTL